jgi:tetratricopeptide (TPR) repeat protein
MPDVASSEIIAAGPRVAMLEDGLDAARAALEAGDLTGALAAWAGLRAMCPDAPEPFRYAAAALVAACHFDEADILLEAAAERFPDDPAVAAAFARAASQIGDVPAALRRWERALDRFPADVAIATGLAATLRAAGRYTAAEARLRSAGSQFPNDPRPLAELASTALAKQDYAGAIGHWRASRELFTALPDGYEGGAEALTAAGRFDEADALLTDALTRFPDHPALRIQHARVAAARRDWAEASRRWEIVRERHPGRIQGYTGHAAVWRDLGQFDAADAVLAEALVRMPAEPDLRAAYAAVARARSDWTEAAARLAHMRTLFPGRADGYTDAIDTLREAERYKEAEVLAIETLRRFPARLEPALAFARLAQARGDLPAANVRWRKTVARFPDAAEVSLGFARFLREQGEVQESGAVLTDAQARFPDLPDPLRQRAEHAAPEEAAAIEALLHERFPWLFARDPADRPGMANALPMPIAGRAEPIRLTLTGFHLSYQISLLFGRMLPFRDRLKVEWIDAGMDLDGIRTRLPEAWLGGTDIYFEESMVGNAATKQCVRHLLPPAAEIRTFPTSTVRALWPFHGPDPRLVPEPPVYNGGRYVDPDRVAATLANPALTDDALFDMYMEITEAETLDLDALYAADLERLTAEDAGRDVRMAPFVAAHFRDEMLFAAPHERCSPIVKEVARQLLATPALRDICDLDTALAGLDRLTLGWRAHGRALPVHPRVARQLGLTWWSADMQYELGHNSFTFREYFIRYMRWSPRLG